MITRVFRDAGQVRRLLQTLPDFFPATPAKQLHIAAMALNRRPSTEESQKRG